MALNAAEEGRNSGHLLPAVRNSGDIACTNAALCNMAADVIGYLLHQTTDAAPLPAQRLPCTLRVYATSPSRAVSPALCGGWA